MDKFLSLKYYFAALPDPNFQYTKLTLFVVGLLILGALVIRVYRKKYAQDEIIRKMLKRYPGALITFSIALMVLLLFREAGIPIFSMRLWWFLLGAYFVYWATRNCLGLKKEYHERKTQLFHHQAHAKYLPRKKR